MSDLTKRWKIEVDARNAQLHAGSEGQHLFARRCGGVSVSIEGDARFGDGELDSRAMNNIAPNQEPIAPGLDKLSVVTRVWFGVGKDLRPGATSSLSLCGSGPSRGRAALGPAESPSTFGQCASHCAVVSPECNVVFVHDQVGGLEDGTSVGVR